MINNMDLIDKIAQMIMVRVRSDYYSSDNYYKKNIDDWIINKKRFVFDMPMPLAKFQSQILEMLPMKPILTKNQCLILQEADNIVSGNFLTIKDLGIKPTDIESVMPNWLWRYRSGAFREFSKT